MSFTNYYPVPTKEDLKSAYVGSNLLDVPVPSAILDLAKVKRNCRAMLDAIQELEVSFRAHIKTHKTNELTRLQVGADSKDVRLVVSTVVEAESVADLLLDYKNNNGSKISLLYGIPLAVSQVPRLAALAQKLGPGSIAALIDNPEQLSSVRKFKETTGFPMCVFIKTDSGYHRAGILPESSQMVELLVAIGAAEEKQDLNLLGFYSHNSLSYAGSSPNEAMDMLKAEIDACRQASTHLTMKMVSRSTPLIISVGSSPTALSVQNIVESKSSSSLSRPPPPSSSSPPTPKAAGAATTAPAHSDSARALRDTLDLTASSFELEIHAGVYPVFDLQQVAASSREFPSSLEAHDTIALSVLAEVVSTYPDRTANPEALVNTGGLALAREPCKSYPGWGVLSSWNMRESDYDADMAVDAKTRIIVSRISQEHGILAREDQGRKDKLPLQYGQRVRLWPNHACITSAGFGWYLIVDSEGEGNGETVVDVWPRWRGW